MSPLRATLALLLCQMTGRGLSAISLPRLGAARLDVQPPAWWERAQPSRTPAWRAPPSEPYGADEDEEDEVASFLSVSAAREEAREAQRRVRQARSDAAILRQVDALAAQITARELQVAALQRQLSPPARARLAMRQLTRPMRASVGVLARRLAGRTDHLRFLSSQTLISAKVFADLLARGSYGGAGLLDVLPHSQLLAVHAPAIYAHIDKLAKHVPGIIGILDANLHFIEPHLDAILERFDDIEPHLPWVLRHIDELAPYCGELLQHIDSLLLYADGTALEPAGGALGWADRLVPYVPHIVPHLAELEGHLPYLLPHLDKVYPHLPVLAPYIGRFSRHAVCSQHADVLLWWFGWVLRVPVLHRLFRVPGVPRLCAWAAGWLPRRWARGPNCAGVECSVEGLYDGASGWNRLLPDDDLWLDSLLPRRRP